MSRVTRAPTVPACQTSYRKEFVRPELFCSGLYAYSHPVADRIRDSLIWSCRVPFKEFRVPFGLIRSV